jgi:hypothetical protein
MDGRDELLPPDTAERVSGLIIAGHDLCSVLTSAAAGCNANIFSSCQQNKGKAHWVEEINRPQKNHQQEERQPSRVETKSMERTETGFSQRSQYHQSLSTTVLLGRICLLEEPSLGLSALHAGQLPQPSISCPTLWLRAGNSICRSRHGIMHCLDDGNYNLASKILTPWH